MVRENNVFLTIFILLGKRQKIVPQTKSDLHNRDNAKNRRRIGKSYVHEVNGGPRRVQATKKDLYPPKKRD